MAQKKKMKHKTTHTTNSVQQSPSWEASSRSASQEISRLLWNPEGSIPCSQEQATGSCPEPDESSPLSPNL